MVTVSALNFNSSKNRRRGLNSRRPQLIPEKPQEGLQWHTLQSLLGTQMGNSTAWAMPVALFSKISLPHMFDYQILL